MKIAEIKSIFDKISNETCVSMGRSIVSCPRKYFTSVIPVPPITMRPYFKNTLTNKSHRTSPSLDFIKNLIRKECYYREILKKYGEKVKIFLNKM